MKFCILGEHEEIINLIYYRHDLAEYFGSNFELKS